MSPFTVVYRKWFLDVNIDISEGGSQRREAGFQSYLDTVGNAVFLIMFTTSMSGTMLAS